jgi:hypothetical protein
MKLFPNGAVSARIAELKKGRADEVAIYLRAGELMAELFELGERVAALRRRDEELRQYLRTHEEAGLAQEQRPVALAGKQAGGDAFGLLLNNGLIERSAINRMRRICEILKKV